MRTLFTILAAVLLTASVFAQSPEKMSYQAVIRNSSDQLVTNQTVGMQISILQGSASGTVVYTETQTPTTNANGLVSIKVGNGTVVSGDFAAIDWANGTYFIKTETDPAGGTSYSITGTSQLLSVPYALHAKTAETVTGGITETDPVFTAWDKSTGISITESQISDLGTYIETETDPVFEASPASDIESSDITNWNVAHGWGDHSAEDYLTEESQDLADVLSHDNDADGNQIKNLADPTDQQDAATKAYVDESAPATYEIGDEAHGGIVFYVEPCGTKGLVAATEDQSDGIKWRGGSTNYATMARGHELYAGKMNTSIIIAVHAAKNDIDDHAALICANYTGGDFGDWYLPSREELKLMYDNLHTQSLGGFANTWYWSSSEYSAGPAWVFSFSGGYSYFNDKDYTYRVRAVRAF